jgi:tRNA (guanine37-N1)-methyltransferase
MAFAFDILTLFPPLFAGLRQESLLGKAQEAGVIDLRLHDWRAWTTDRHNTVDDAPFGGGAGLVLKPDPLLACLRDVLAPLPVRPPVVLLSPAGTLFSQATARRWSQGPGLVLLCGRYEGFDARVEPHVDEVVSIGDYVLNGGEVAAMAITEAVARLLPGVIGNAASLQQESHGEGLLEYPQYTRPRDFEGAVVPEILLSGDHAKIAQWRHRQSLLRTRDRRPDLLAMVRISAQDRAWLDAQPATESPSSAPEPHGQT